MHSRSVTAMALSLPWLVSHVAEFLLGVVNGGGSLSGPEPWPEVNPTSMGTWVPDACAPTEGPGGLAWDRAQTAGENVYTDREGQTKLHMKRLVLSERRPLLPFFDLFQQHARGVFSA